MCFFLLFFYIVCSCFVGPAGMVQEKKNMHGGMQENENSLEGKRQVMHRQPLFIGRQIGTAGHVSAGPTCTVGWRLIGAVRSTSPNHAKPRKEMDAVHIRARTWHITHNTIDPACGYMIEQASTHTYTSIIYPCYIGGPGFAGRARFFAEEMDAIPVSSGGRSL